MARSFGVICAPPESHQSGSSLGEILLPQNTSSVPPKEPSRYPPPPARQLEVSRHQNGISLCALPPPGLLDYQGFRLNLDKPIDRDLLWIINQIVLHGFCQTPVSCQELIFGSSLFHDIQHFWIFRLCHIYLRRAFQNANPARHAVVNRPKVRRNAPVKGPAQWPPAKEAIALSPG